MESKQVGLLLTVVMLVLAFDCGNCNDQGIGKVVSIRSNAANGIEDSESVLHRDSRSVHRSRRSLLTSQQEQEAIDNHNRVRRLEGASDMEMMTWNPDLVTMANGWADKCNFSHGQPSTDIPSTLKYTQLGQNLYAKSGLDYINITDAIQSWYNEYENFTYDTLECKKDQMCGHYTQVVWATSRELGCAYKKCDSLINSTLTNAILLVCNYGPPGNVEGQKPFKKGSGCSRCSNRSWWCTEGLCDGRCNATGKLTCGCAPVCLNFGSVNSATCSCSCVPGWYGSDCSVECKNYDSQCDPQPGQWGWPPSYCTDSNGPQVREKCPKMCNQCKAANNSNYPTSMKPSLLTILSVWLSWLFVYSFRSI